MKYKPPLKTGLLLLALRTFLGEASTDSGCTKTQPRSFDFIVSFFRKLALKIA